MSIEEIRALKEKFFESDDHKVKDKLARDAIYKAGMMLRRELDWATSYDAALMLQGANLLTCPDTIDVRYLEKAQSKVATAPNAIKLMVLARLLSGLSFSDTTIELASALRQLVDGKNPSLLKATPDNQLGNNELWAYRVNAIACIAYLKTLGYKGQEAIEIIADAYGCSVETVVHWKRQARWPSGLDVGAAKINIEDARRKGLLYKESHKNSKSNDDSEYGLAAIIELGNRYKLIVAKIGDERSLKRKGQ